MKQTRRKRLSQHHLVCTNLRLGLCNAPATFQLMSQVLAGLQWSVALVYLDDIIIFSPNLNTHFVRLRRVFDALHRENLKIKPRKCYFFQSSIKYLGHIVSREGISTDPEKTSTIISWPNQQMLRKSSNFLGSHHIIGNS